MAPATVGSTGAREHRRTGEAHARIGTKIAVVDAARGGGTQFCAARVAASRRCQPAQRFVWLTT